MNRPMLNSDEEVLISNPWDCKKIFCVKINEEHNLEMTNIGPLSVKSASNRSR